MMYISFSIFMMMVSFLFLNMSHPLALGLTLLLQTLNMCIMISMISKSSWFSFILFLILLGGMLVLFMYIVSLAPNEKFSFSTKLMFMMIIILSTILMILIFSDNMKLMPMFNNKEMMTINNFLSFLPENTLSLNKLYNPPIYTLTMILIIYLLITLITIVHITKNNFGPLRTSNLKMKN
uniref:NADH-ubiquinone oxidoreductase chain 6 n=1 Tax=Melanagromyza sojae TaxID=1838149 RepID=A0A3G1DK61_MELSO|nr:NADH dehydrogenase subunit 6 [Melanagromyza sojae]ANA56777.1 NADH dehydrogenase subunit 6 [Melanagromyza sojae]